MSIITKDGFFFFESFNKPLSLILDKRIDEIIEYVNVNEIKSLTIQPNLYDILPKGDCQNNILSDIANTDFLEHVPKISEISFKDIKDCNLSGLYHLKNLRSLTIANTVNNPSINERVDFSKFDGLEELFVDWFDKGFDISKNQKLVTVSIHKYYPQSLDFSELQLPKSIKNIELIRSNIQTLKGIESNSIEKLEFYYCPRLKSLYGISALSGQLHRLMIENAKQLTAYDSLYDCKLLDSVVFVNCGNIDSLKRIKMLKNLSHFVLEKTVVNDGNMENLLAIDRVAFTNYKHYNCKCKSLNNDDWGYKIMRIL